MLFAGACALGLLWLSAGAPLGAGGKKADDKKLSFEDIMTKMGTPGPNHKLLEPLIGKWQCKVKIYIEPGKDPIESEATAERKWIMDGRYIAETYDGNAFGKPFKGMGLIGYDNAKKKYSVVWIDSMSTSIMFTTGTYDAATKTFTYRNEDVDPFSGTMMKSRDIVRIVDADHHRLEMYKQPPGGKEFKTIEISCTRKKS
jgi:hypothetical protein